MGRIQDIFSMRKALRLTENLTELIPHDDFVLRIISGFDSLLASVCSAPDRFGHLYIGLRETLQRTRQKLLALISNIDVRYSALYREIDNDGQSLLEILNFDWQVYRNGVQQNTLYSAPALFGALNRLIEISDNPLLTAVILRIFIANFGIFNDIGAPKGFYSLLALVAYVASDGLLNAYNLEIFKNMMGITPNNEFAVLRASNGRDNWTNPLQCSLDVMDQLLDADTETLRSAFFFTPGWGRVIEWPNQGQYQINLTDNQFFDLVGIKPGVESQALYNLLEIDPVYQQLAVNKADRSIAVRRRVIAQQIRYQWRTYLILKFIVKTKAEGRIRYIQIQSTDNWSHASRIFRFDLLSDSDCPEKAVANEIGLLRSIMEWQDHVSGTTLNMEIKPKGSSRSYWGRRSFREIENPFGTDNYVIRDEHIPRHLGFWSYSGLNLVTGIDPKAFHARRVNLVTDIWECLTGRSFTGRQKRVIGRGYGARPSRSIPFTDFLGLHYLEEFAGLMDTYLEILYQLKTRPLPKGDLSATVTRAQAFRELETYTYGGLRTQINAGSALFELIDHPLNHHWKNDETVLDLILPNSSSISLLEITSNDLDNTREWVVSDSFIISVALDKRRQSLEDIRIPTENGFLDPLEATVPGSLSEEMLGEIADLYEGSGEFLRFLKTIPPETLGKAGLKYLNFLELKEKRRIRRLRDPNTGTSISLSIALNSRRSQAHAMVDYIEIWVDDKKNIYFVLKQDKKFVQREDGTYHISAERGYSLLRSNILLKKDLWNMTMLAKKEPDRFFRSLEKGENGLKIVGYQRSGYEPLMGSPNAERAIWEALVDCLTTVARDPFFFYIQRNMAVIEQIKNNLPLFKISYQFGMNKNRALG
jgi:hypothetical protein